MNKYIFTVTDLTVKTKLGIYLRSRLKMSVTVINKLKYGHIYVNGMLAITSQVLCVGDVITLTVPPDVPNAFAEPKKIPLDIVFEDDYFLVVKKPVGMPTHNSKGTNEISLQQAVLGYFAPNPFTFRAINRLDKDTSGLIVVAKDQIIAGLLGEQMACGGFLKTYVALADGVINQDHFIVDAPISRLETNGQKRGVVEGGKRAVTECFVVERRADSTLLKIVLHTGRTHQIRVHLSHVGHPLCADALYGTKVEGKTYFLQSTGISFLHPITKEYLSFTL